MKKRLLALLLALVMVVGLLPAAALSAPAPEAPATTDTPGVTSSVRFLNQELTQAEITYTVPAVPMEQGVNVIILADVSQYDTRHTVFNALDYALNNLDASLLMTGYDTPNQVQIIAYDTAVVADSGVLTDATAITTALGQIPYQSAQNTASESAGLAAAAQAVKDLETSGQPTAVVWVMGENMSESQEAVTSALTELQTALGQNGMLIVHQEGSDALTEPTEYLKDYVTTYVNSDVPGTTQHAIYRSNRDTSVYDLGANLYESLIALTSDGYRNKYIGTFADHLDLQITLNQSQTMATAFDQTFSDIRVPIMDQAGGGLGWYVNVEGGTLSFTPSQILQQDSIQISLRVELNPDVDTAEVISAFQWTLPLRTGYFDQNGTEVTLDFPAVTIDRTAQTITYELGEGVEGGPVQVQTAEPNNYVTLDDASSISKPGESFGGWLVTAAPGNENLVGQRYNAGAVITMPNGPLTLKPLWGHVEVELEVGQAVPAPEVTSHNYMMLNAGAIGANAFDFSAIEHNGRPIGQNVTSIRFADYTVEGEPAGDTDPYHINVASGASDAIYARQIGYDDPDQNIDSNVVAYVHPHPTERGKYEIVITAEGGVYGLDAQTLFTALNNGSILVGGGWNANVTQIDLTHFHTENVQYFNAMFAGMYNLETITGLTDLDVSNAISMRQMFMSVGVETLDLTGWDTSKVTDTRYMFASSLTTTSTGAFVSRVEPKLRQVIGIEEWDVSSLQDAVGMFSNSGLSTLDLSKWAPVSMQGTGIQLMFWHNEHLTSVNLSGWSMPRLTGAGFLFRGCTNLQTVDVSGWNVPNLTTLGYAFLDCSSLTELDLSTWTTGSIQDMYETFLGCTSLERLNLTGLIQSYQNSFFYLTFEDTDNLNYLDISGWTINGNPSLASTIETGMFASYDTFSGGTYEDVTLIADGWNITTDFPSGISSTTLLTPLNIASFGSVSAKNWNFNGHTVDLNNISSYIRLSKDPDQAFEGWTGLSGVTKVDNMFSSGGANLKTIELKGLNIDNISSFTNLFTRINATELTSLDFSGWTGSDGNLSRLDDMFTALTTATGVNMGGITLTVTDDTIGQYIATKFEEAGGSNVTKVSAASTASTQSAARQSAAANAAPVASSTGTGETPGVQTLSVEPLADDGTAVYTVVHDSLWEHGEQSASGNDYYLKATVKFVGDEGAISGDIDLSVILPGTMAVMADPEIVTGAFTSTASGGSASGVVRTAAAISGSTLTAKLGNMTTGTEIEISFRAEMIADGTPSADRTRTIAWEPSATAADANTTDTHTYRFWRQEGGGTITPPDPGVTYYISASAGNGGSISPSGRVPVAAGERQTFTISASEGYEIVNVLVDGESVGQVSSYTFTNVRSNHTISVIFRDADGVADPDDTGVSDWLDTDNHNAYLQGYGNNLFAPDADMTRAEVAQLFYNLLREKDVAITVSFDDVPAGRWYTDAVNTLASLGIIVGAGDGNFYPNSPITRAEFTAIAMRFTKGDVAGDVSFTDVSPSSWYYRYVVGAVRYGWIVGYGNGLFAPNASITRAEVTTIANRMLGRSADEAYVDSHLSQLKQFADVTGGWAYYQIMEATNGHTHTIADGQETWTGLK